jgi:hypothetical protein
LPSPQKDVRFTAYPHGAASRYPLEMSNTAIFIVLIASMAGLVAALMLLLGYYGIHQSRKHEIHLLRHRHHLLRTRGKRDADLAAR